MLHPQGLRVGSNEFSSQSVKLVTYAVVVEQLLVVAKPWSKSKRGSISIIYHPYWLYKSISCHYNYIKK